MSAPDLLGRPAAVDHQLAARHEQGLVRGEVEDGVRDFFRLTVTAERDAREHATVGLWIGATPLGHRRDDRPRMDRVRPDPLAGVLERGRLRQPPYCTLGRGVL